MTTRHGTALIEQMNALSAPQGTLALWWLGQMGVAIKGARDVLYIDPYLTGVMPDAAPPGALFVRAYAPPLQPAEVTNASYVLCSHEHGDHTDPGTLAGIAQSSPNAKVLYSGWAEGQLDKAGIAADRRIVAREPITLGEFKITPVPSAHYTRESDPVKGERWMGFWIEGNGVTFFHTGDTVIFDGYVDFLKQLPRADLAVMCSNGRDARRDSHNIAGNLMPVEAAWLAQMLAIDTMIFGHNDLFPFNSLTPGAPAEAIATVNPRQKWHMLQPGELFMYVR